jgi:hypothetical protein
MKLGIGVVYFVLPGDEKLLDLHLRYIEQCTRAPFTIYAAVNRLPERLTERLAANPSVRICPVPPTEDRGSLENAYYLERLIAEAIAEGCTHIATFHVDSFPIRVGWEFELEQQTSSEYAFAAAVREESRFGKPTTAGLFFPREFYTHYRPRLLLSRSDVRSRVGQTYAKKLWNPRESGTGYGFVAFREELRWLPLRRTNRGEDHYYFGSIHGDVIFHLGASAHAGRLFPGAQERKRFQSIRRIARMGLPRPVRKLLRRLVPNRVLFPESALHQRAHSRVKQALLEDPAFYLDRLRTTNGTSQRISRNPDTP